MIGPAVPGHVLLGDRQHGHVSRYLQEADSRGAGLPRWHELATEKKAVPRPTADLDRVASQLPNMADTTQGLTKRLEFSDLGGVGSLEQADPEALIHALRHPTADGFAR